ncbi:MAG: hypothetical protein ABEJ42_09050 [Halobacteriaceae archaeon]
MDRGTLVAVGLVLASLPLFFVPALFPAGDVLEHDTSPYLAANASLEGSDAARVVTYENLTERARTLYRETLRRGGTYRVPLDEGAPEFRYPEPGTTDYRPLVIVRPADADLPPADEEYQKSFDLVTTATTKPDFGSGAYLHHVVALVLGVALFVGGPYLYVRG